MITRMDYQKGVDLAIQALQSIHDQPWQAIILGTGNPVLEQTAFQLHLQFPQRVRSVLRFDPGLSRQIYAAADLLLIPSRYEPCGLTQMIAMKYGTIPLGRATGGLKDTIIDNQDPSTWCGFLFDKPTPEDLAQTLLRAIEAYRNSNLWQKMQLNAMNQDFSWKRSAAKYFHLYQEIYDRYHDQAE
jgi:starch synthase